MTDTQIILKRLNSIVTNLVILTGHEFHSFYTDSIYASLIEDLQDNFKKIQLLEENKNE